MYPKKCILKNQGVFDGIRWSRKAADIQQMRGRTDWCCKGNHSFQQKQIDSGYFNENNGSPCADC